MKFPLTKISASTLNCYLQCPFAFKLLYIDGYEAKVGKALDIGSMFDLMFKSFHLRKDPYETCKNKFFSNPPSQDEIDNFAVAKKLLEKYKLLPHLFVCPEFDIGFGIHCSFKEGKAKIKLTGYLDGIDSTPIGKIGIEVKTTTENWTKERVDKELQATIYAYYLYVTYNIEKPLINYIVFNKKTLEKQEFLTTRNKTDFDNLFEIIDQFIKDVEDENFDKNPNHPFYCQCRTLSRELNLL